MSDKKCSYTIKLRGDYLTVSRKECKSKSEFYECCLWTRKWSSDGDQYVTGFGVYDCFDLHIEVLDKMGQTVFEADITPDDLNGKDGAFPIGLYAGHDTLSGVQVSNEPVRRTSTNTKQTSPQT